MSVGVRLSSVSSPISSNCDGGSEADAVSGMLVKRPHWVEFEGSE